MSKRGMLLIGGISITVLLTGCFEGEQSMKEIDPPQNAEAVDNLEDITEAGADTLRGETEDAAANTVSRQLYLLDSNGMVASQVLDLPLPATQEVAAQSLEFLVKGGPVTDLLPNGFQAVLPEGTEVRGIDLQEDGTIIVDLSAEFGEYEAAEELKILESVTHTLTQFDNVNKVKLRVEGQNLSEMPVNGTPINNGYTKANGINIVDTDTLDLIESKPVTMYYPAEHAENRYYVPVTQYVEQKDDNMYASIVSALLEGPGYNTNIVHVFNAEALLVNEPNLDDGVLELVFNEAILQDENEPVIADEVMETIVRTLTEQQNVEAVDVKVENVDQLVNENGDAYTEPVTRQDFVPAEKL